MSDQEAPMEAPGPNPSEGFEDVDFIDAPDDDDEVQAPLLVEGEEELNG